MEEPTNDADRREFLQRCLGTPFIPWHDILKGVSAASPQESDYISTVELLLPLEASLRRTAAFKDQLKGRNLEELLSALKFFVGRLKSTDEPFGKFDGVVAIGQILEDRGYALPSVFSVEQFARPEIYEQVFRDARVRERERCVARELQERNRILARVIGAVIDHKRQMVAD